MADVLKLSFCAAILIFFVCQDHFQVRASTAAGQETLIGIVGHDFIMLGADSSSSSSIAVTASNLDKIFILANPFPTSSAITEKHKLENTEQQVVAAAAAGNAADADRLLRVLQAHAAIREYEASVGCDVECIFNGIKQQNGSFHAKDSIQDSILYTPKGLDAESMAYCARKEIATALRSSTPFQLCLLIAGMVQTSQLTPVSSKKSCRSKNDQQMSSVSNRIHSQIYAAKQRIKGTSTKSPSSLYTNRQKTQVENVSTLSLEPRLIWLDQYGSLQTIEYGAHGYGANFALSILDQGFRQNMSRSEALALMKGCFEQLRMRYVINSPQPPCIKCIDANGSELMM